MTDDTLRENFERRARQRGLDLTRRTHGPGVGDYEMPSTFFAWEFYLAAHREAGEDTERLEWIARSGREIYEFKEGWQVSDDHGLFADGSAHHDFRAAIDAAKGEA